MHKTWIFNNPDSSQSMWMISPSIFKKKIKKKRLKKTNGPDEAVSVIMEQLQHRFQHSEVGKLHYLLGIQGNQQEGVISLSQGRYVN